MMQIDCEISDATLLYFDDRLGAQFRRDNLDRRYFDRKDFENANDYHKPRVNNP